MTRYFGIHIIFIAFLEGPKGSFASFTDRPRETQIISVKFSDIRIVRALGALYPLLLKTTHVS